MAQGSSLGLRAALAFTALLAACSELRSQGEQCVFNDDCESPFVCAGHRCRFQCRSDRDCAMGSVCLPSESPIKRVCVPAREASLCGGDAQCPTGSVCLDTACWWTCRDDATCAARSSGTCQQPPAVCTAPVTARVQHDAPPREQPAVTDGGVDAAPDVTVMDVAVTDVTIADVTAMDATVTDATATDVTATDVTVTDVAVTDVTLPLCERDGDCSFTHATGSCVDGRCRLGACMTGYGDCNGNPLDGCEASLTDDPQHCGSCVIGCPRGPGVMEHRCAAGRCQVSACMTGLADCNGNPIDGCEVDLTSSVANCGACANVCSVADAGALAAVCRGATCGYSMCQSGRGDCDGVVSNGCETDTTTNTDHCGACMTPCLPRAGGTVSCVARACVLTCATGRGDCNSNPADGCETDLTIAPEHCGGCRRRCPGAEACVDGACRPFAYAAGDALTDFAPTVDTVLPSGVHRYRSVTIPADVTVTTTAPGVLEILARAEVRIAGVIDVSGGNGAPGNASLITDCSGGNGGGGETGTGTSGAGAPTTCNAPGAGGSGFPGSAGAFANGSCGGGGRNGGGAGASPFHCVSDCGGGGGGGGGYGGGAGGGGYANAAGGGAGGGEVRAGVVGGGPAGSVATGGIGGTAGSDFPALVGRRGQDGSVFGFAAAGGGGGGSIGPEAAHDLRMASTFRPGSGGGGGGATGFSTSTSSRCAVPGIGGGGGGGGGGGALRVASATRIVVVAGGRLLANGGAGGSTSRTNGSSCQGAGGGGSGGAIFLTAPALEIHGTVSAVGGAGGTSPTVNRCAGGAGGVGRIHVATNLAHCVRGGAWTPDWNGPLCVARADAPGAVTTAVFP